MISLNLLSPQQKEALKTLVFCVLVERFTAGVVVLAGVLTIALISVKIGLADQLHVIEARQLLSSEYSSTNQDTRNINAIAARVDKIQGASIALSPVIQDLLSRVPDGVQVSVLSLEAESLGFSVSGVAATRDELLAFETALRGSPYLTKVDNPLNNLFEKTDAHFTMTAALQLSATGTQVAPKP
jgi:Tfp pilus assembly protein PilN